MYTIELMDNKSEIIRYNVPHMPIKVSASRQEDYPSLSVVNHWHNDFEFIYVCRGTMWYSVNGEPCPLEEGQMIFVNSGQMHYAFWDKPCNCEFQCTIFHPSIATHESTQEQMDYILHNSPPYLILHPEVLSEKELIDLVLELYRSAQKQEGAYALQLYSCIYRICYRLWEKMQNVVNPWEPNDSKQLEAMHKMVGFIQQNYSLSLIHI